MVVDLFEKALGLPPVLPAPLVKVNQSLATNLEKMLVFQVNALRASFDFGLNQMKAAAEIEDVKSLQDFYKCQSQIAQTLQWKMLSDARAIVEMTGHFKSALDNVAQVALEDILPQAA